MHRRYDLRRPADVRELAALLPEVDGRRILTTPAAFCAALGTVSELLGSPSWLTYYRGVVGPYQVGAVSDILDLRSIVVLGQQLELLRTCDNFGSLLEGFRNPPQFRDTMFEVHVAAYFVRLQSVRSLAFSPVVMARGRLKRPDFVAYCDDAPIYVECKQPHLHVHKAIRTVAEITDAMEAQMKGGCWPDAYRLELSLLSPLREHPRTFAARVADIVGHGKGPHGASRR